MSVQRPDLDAIEERASAATPGPWTLESDGSVRSPEDAPVFWIHEHGSIHTIQHTGETWSGADGRFIASSRTDVPALTAYARWLEEDGRRRDNEYIEVCHDLSVKADLAWARAVKAEANVERLNAARTMQWDYDIMTVDTAQYDLKNRLKQYGQEGWELVQVERDSCNVTFYMKRLIEETDSSPSSPTGAAARP